MVQRKSKLRWIPKIDPNAEIEEQKLKALFPSRVSKPNDENRPPNNNIQMSNTNHQESKPEKSSLAVQEDLKSKGSSKEERKEEENGQKGSPQVRFVKILKGPNSDVEDKGSKSPEEGEKGESKVRIEDQIKDLEKMLEEGSQKTVKSSSEKQSSSSSQKKRGRPRKHPLPKKDESDKENLLKEAVPVENQVEEPKQMQVESQETGKIEVEKTEVESEKEVVVTPPRKRGRPRKNKVSETSSTGKESFEGAKTEIFIANPEKMSEENPKEKPEESIESPKPSSESPKQTTEGSKPSTDSPKSSTEDPKPKRGRGRPPKKEKKMVIEQESSEPEALNQKRERPDSIEKVSEEAVEDQAYPSKKVKTRNSSSNKMSIKLAPKVKTSNEKICKDNEDELFNHESSEANKSLETDTKDSNDNKESVQLSPKVTEAKEVKKEGAKRRGRPGRPKKVSK